MSKTMRPLEFGELLDGAFTLLRRHFSTFFGIAILPQLPILLLWLALPVMAANADPTEVLGAVTVLIWPYSMFAAVLTFGALVHAAAVSYEGGQPRVGESLSRALRSFLPLAVASVLGFAAMMLGFMLLIIPGLILFAMWFAMYPAIMVERAGPIESLGRSRALSRGARMRILGVLVVAWLITMLPVIALTAFAGAGMGVTAALSAMSMEDGSLWMTAMIQLASTLASGVTWPFVMIVTTLLYFDRRARTEAPDLESAAAELNAY